MGMRYEHHQHQHVTNVDARQMHVEENRVMNVLNADPMVVAQAHHMVADMRNQAIQFAQNAQSQAQSQVSVIEAQAHSALQQVEANASDRVRHTHEVASMQVSQSQEEASRLVQDARSEVVNQQTMIEQLKAVIMERNQHIVQVTHALSEREQALATTQSQMHSMQTQLELMMTRMKEQEEMIQSLQSSSSHRPKDSLIVPIPPPPKGGSNTGLSIPKSFAPLKPSSSEPGSREEPFVASIATPKHSHPGTVQLVPDAGQSSFAMPIASGSQREEMHLAPSQTQGSGVAQPKHPSLPPEFLEQWHRGNQINGDQNMALSMQVQQLANQVQIMAGMMAGSMQPGHQQGSNRSVNWPRDPGSPPGSGSSSSSDSNRKRGGGRGQGPPSNQSPLGDGGSPSNGSNPSSSDSEDPYKKEKRLMRIKQYDGMKLPALPQDAAKCRNFRNAVFSTVCKFAKNDESEVFRWINRCNLSDDGKEFSKSNDFPILDRILGAKVLELAKSTKFALEFQTHQERCQASNQQPKGRTLLWLIFQKYKLDRDRGTALSQHHLLSLKMNGNDIKALEDFRQRYDFCVGALEVREPEESSKNGTFN